jgi:hypothetical protein
VNANGARGVSNRLSSKALDYLAAVSTGLVGHRGAVTGLASIHR